MIFINLGSNTKTTAFLSVRHAHFTDEKRPFHRRETPITGARIPDPKCEKGRPAGGIRLVRP